jgi:hypothetical protein
MSTLGLAAIVALVAAALLAGVLRFRRRRPAPRPGPRTVAELVQLRAAAARSEPGRAGEVQAELPSEPGSTSIEIEAGGPGVSEPMPVAATAQPDSPAAKRNGRGTWASSADTPWGRARRMIDAEPPAPPMTNGQVGHPAAAADDSAATSSSAEHEAPTGSPAPAVPDHAPAGSTTPAFEAASAAPAEPGSPRSAVLPAAAQARPAASSEDVPAAAEDGQPQLTPSAAAASESRPATSVDLDDPAPEASPAAAADSRPARTLDLEGPVPAEPQSAAADPHPARTAAPEPGETDEQASRRVLRLVPPLPSDSTIPVQRTQAPDSELALLGALGLVDPAAEPEPALAGVDGRRSRPDGSAGPAQQIRFRVARRDGSAVPGAEVDLLDEDGQHVATGYADAGGCGELRAPHPGTYLLVCVAPEHQPGVATVSVADGPGEAALLVARSAVLTGSVRASYTPVVAARLTVVQDGEIVGGTHSDSAGAYRIADLGPGGYGLCVTAPGCVPAAVRIDVADGTELQRDIDLQRAGDVQREVVESPGELPEQATAADRQVVGNR